MKKIATLVLTGCLLSLVMVTTYAKAQDTNVPDFRDIITDPLFPQSNFTGNITDLLDAIIQWLLLIAGCLAVIAIVVSGIMYIISGGDPTKAETAKKNLTWAIIGLVIILASSLIVFIVIHILH